MAERELQESLEDLEQLEDMDLSDSEADGVKGGFSLPDDGKGGLGGKAVSLSSKGSDYSSKKLR